LCWLKKVLIVVQFFLRTVGFLFPCGSVSIPLYVPKKRSTLYTILRFDFVFFSRLKLFSYPYQQLHDAFFFLLSVSFRFFATTNSKKDLLLFFRNPIWNVFVCECVYASFGSCGTFFPALTKSCFIFLSLSNKQFSSENSRFVFCN
jgi:hypothetical protein